MAAAKSATQAYAEFEDNVADVMKTMGMSEPEAMQLSDRLSKINTRASQNKLPEPDYFNAVLR